MKIYDLSKGLLSTKAYPGDPEPEVEKVCKIENGDGCNLSRLSMGSHNGTHMDAPSHFYEKGRTVDRIDLEKCIGICRVVSVNGQFDEKEAVTAIRPGDRRLLIKGDVMIMPGGAKELCRQGIVLLGVEGMTVGNGETQAEIHFELLGSEVVILENLDLQEVPDGEYFLAALPLKIEGCDGSPCRPVLISGNPFSEEGQ
ncbi:cyclase family protein [Anaerobium acetethylicum]|uniref:Arylformamidase n=1 Tax=Anaerobium acetethylicum TaxID=1619234 RepID=A0A1D3TQU5_9FIRM|nr:cyclase family protein [Anaerobium acetethylicum]SCP95996.1 arylformamidase [Anaerobium acetethylicum]